MQKLDDVDGYMLCNIQCRSWMMLMVQKLDDVDGAEVGIFRPTERHTQ